MPTLKAVFISALLLITFLGHSENSYAHWQKQDDAAAHYDEYKVALRVNRDYTVEVTEEFTATIEKQAAIKDFSIIEAGYVPELSQVKILAARTINGGQTYNIDPRLVVDKAVASKQPGYDSLREVRLSLSQLAIGAKVYLKLWRKSFPNSFPNFVSEMIAFDEVYPIRSYEFQMDSAIPVTYKFFDPRHQFAVTESKSTQGIHLAAKSTTTIFQRIAQEPFSVFTEPQAPVFYLSNGASWNTFGNPIAAEYDRILRAPLPSDFQKIADEAKKKKLRLDQVEYVLSALQKLIHYVGNWQTVHGKYFSRSLSEIALTRFGDCKDYTVSATAILRSLGFEAIPAWTKIETQDSSQNDATASPTRIISFKPPLPGQYFNHAVLKLIAENNEYWLDPTSPIPYGRGIPPELAGAYALLLKPNAAQLESIPLPSHDENSMESTRYIAINGDRTSDELSRIRIKGYFSALLTYQYSSMKKSSFEHIDELLRQFSGDTNTKTEQEFNGEIAFDKGQAGIDLSGSTSAGAGIQLGFNRALLPFALDHTQSAGSLFLASPGRVLETTIIQGGALLGDLPPACHIENTWLTANRTFNKLGDDLKVIEEIDIKKALIASTDLQGAEMKSTQEKLEKCWKQTTLIFQPKSPDDPNFPYKYTKPWTWTNWDINKIKTRKAFNQALKSAHGFITNQPTAVPATEISVAPEWTKDVPAQELKNKLSILLDKKGENLLPFIATKLILLQLIRKSPEDPDYYSYLARCELKLGYLKGDEFDPKALDRTKYYIYRALELNPLDPIANRMLAWYFIDANKLDDARAQAKFAVPLDRYAKKSRLLDAKIAYLSNDYEKALNIVKDMDDYNFLINIYYKLKRYDDVEATYEDQIRFEPGVWAYLNFASFLTTMQRKPDKAIEYAKKSLEIAETGMGHTVLSDAYTFKGDEFVHVRQFAEGINYYQMALAEKNDNSRAQTNLGKVLVFLGRQQKNTDLLNKASANSATNQTFGRAPASLPANSPVNSH